MSDTQGPRDRLRRRALWAILEHAFFRWESAVVIALTLVLMYFVPQLPVPLWQPWFWLVGALAAEGAIVANTLRSPEANAQAVAKMLRADFNPQRLRSPANQKRVQQALEYRGRIAAVLEGQPAGVLREHLEQVATDIDRWITTIYNLAVRLDTYERDEIVKGDLRTAPQALHDLQARLALEDSPSVRTQIEETLRGKQTQLASLRALEETMERASYQLEQTLTALGTVYSQLLLIGVKDIDSGRAQRLRQDIAEQVASLQDLTSSLEEVYQHSADADGLAAARGRLGGTPGTVDEQAAGAAARRASRQ